MTLKLKCVQVRLLHSPKPEDNCVQHHFMATEPLGSEPDRAYLDGAVVVSLRKPAYEVGQTYAVEVSVD